MARSSTSSPRHQPRVPPRRRQGLKRATIAAILLGASINLWIATHSDGSRAGDPTGPNASATPDSRRSSDRPDPRTSPASRRSAPVLTTFQRQAALDLAARMKALAVKTPLNRPHLITVEEAKPLDALIGELAPMSRAQFLLVLRTLGSDPGLPASGRMDVLPRIISEWMKAQPPGQQGREPLREILAAISEILPALSSASRQDWLLVNSVIAQGGRWDLQIMSDYVLADWERRGVPGDDFQRSSLLRSAGDPLIGIQLLQSLGTPPDLGQAGRDLTASLKPTADLQRIAAAFQEPVPGNLGPDQIASLHGGILIGLTTTGLLTRFTPAQVDTWLAGSRLTDTNRELLFSTIALPTQPETLPAWVAWTEAHASPQEAKAILVRLGYAWAASDPTAAEAWITSLPPGPTRAAITLGYQTSSPNPQSKTSPSH